MSPSLPRSSRSRAPDSSFTRPWITGRLTGRSALQLALLLLVPPALAATEPAGITDQTVRRAVLIERYAKDPRALAIATTYAHGRRSGLTGQKLQNFVNDYTKNYDELWRLHKFDELPYTDAQRAVREVATAALTDVVNKYVPVVGGTVATLLTKVVDVFESTVKSEGAAHLGETIADAQYRAVVHLDKSVDQLLAVPDEETRQFLIQSLGVDINKSWQQLTQENPAVGASLFAAETLTGVQRNGRQLAQIMADIQQLDRNDEERKRQLADELRGFITEGLQSVNGNIQSGLGEIAQQQAALQDAILDRSLVIEGEIGEVRGILTSFIKEQHDREEARRNAEIRAEEEARRAAEITAYLQAGVLALDLIEPGLGQKFGVVANSTIQISQAIQAFNAANTGWASIAQLAVGVGNPALAIFSVMSGPGQSTDQQILDQLAQIADMIQELRVHIDERFDAVDAKLGRLEGMLIGIETSLRQLSRQADINLEAVTRNLQVGLDTQSLLLAVAESLHEDIRDLWFVPCIERASTLPLPDEKFIDCVSYLFNHAMNQLPRQQTPWMPGYAPDTLANLLGTHDRTSLEILRREFEWRSGLALPIGTMIPPEAWRTTGRWYRDFLLQDPAQTRRTEILPRLDAVAARGHELAESVDVVLASFEDGVCKVGNQPYQPQLYCEGAAGGLQVVCGCDGNYYPHPCLAEAAGVWRYFPTDPEYPESCDAQPAPAQPFNAPLAFLEAGWDVYNAVSEVIRSRVALYNASTNLQIDPDRIDLSAEELPSNLPLPYQRVGGLAQNVSTTVVENLLGMIPRTVRKLAGAGLGEFIFEIYFDDEDCDECLSIGPDSCRVTEYYSVHVTFRAYAKNDEYLSREIGAHSLATLRRRLPGDSRLCRDWIPELWDPTWLDSEVSRVSAHVWDYFDFATLAAELVAAYEPHRLAIARDVLAELKTQTVNDPPNLENAFFGALTRLAFARNAGSSDPFVGFSTGVAGLPSPMAFAERVEDIRVSSGDTVGLPIVFKADDYVMDEMKALSEYLASEDLPRQVTIARLDLLALSSDAAALEASGALLAPEPDGALLGCASAAALALLRGRRGGHARLERIRRT